MSKILYPVGTSVVVKSNSGNPACDRCVGKLAKVIGYTKRRDNPHVYNGITMPYYLQFKNGETVYASVNELRKPRKKKQSGTATEADKNKTPVANTYTKEEVDLLLAEQWSDMMDMISAVDEVAVKALRNSEVIAGITDRNFRTVSKQFNSLSHDDD